MKKRENSKSIETYIFVMYRCLILAGAPAKLHTNVKEEKKQHIRQTKNDQSMKPFGSIVNGLVFEPKSM